MTKKMMMFLLALMLCAAMVCSGTAEDGLGRTWDRDSMNHWNLLENGEATDVEAHDLEDAVYAVCSVCGTEIWRFENGGADVSNYNDHEDLVRLTSYDELGEMLYDNVFEYAYDEAGNKLFEKQYDNGVFIAESVFAVNAQGEHHVVWAATYYDDGTVGRNEYDENGNCVKAYTFDENGVVTYEETSEYALTSDGWFYYQTKSTAVMDSTVFYHEYNEYGDSLVSMIIEDDVVILNATHEYGYKDGVQLWSRDYMNGVLVGESICDEDGRVVMQTEYNEDGTSCIYTYDDNEDLAMLVWCTAEGEMARVENYVYTYEEDGDYYLSKATFVDGVLWKEEYFGVDEDGFTFTAVEVLYDEEGNATTYEYNAMDEDDE